VEFVAKPRTAVPAEFRGRELRKIAECLRALADRIEAEEGNRESRRRRPGRMNRATRFDHAASGLLMDAVELGGPEDQSLRRVLLSCRDQPSPRWDCFHHVCRAWRPLLYGRVVPSTTDRRACAEAMRVIARGVSH
jgi:hypothetical protein